MLSRVLQDTSMIKCSALRVKRKEDEHGGASSCNGSRTASSSSSSGTPGAGSRGAFGVLESNLPSNGTSASGLREAARLADVLKEKDLEIARLEAKLARQDRALQALRQQQLESELYAAAREVVLQSNSTSSFGDSTKQAAEQSSSTASLSSLDRSLAPAAERTRTQARIRQEQLLKSKVANAALAANAGGAKLPARVQCERFRTGACVSNEVFRPPEGQTLQTRSQEYLGLVDLGAPQPVFFSEVRKESQVIDPEDRLSDEKKSTKSESGNSTTTRADIKNAASPPAAEGQEERATLHPRKTGRGSTLRSSVQEREDASATTEVPAGAPSIRTSGSISSASASGKTTLTEPAREDVQSYPSQLSLLVDLHSRFRCLMHQNALSREGATQAIEAAENAAAVDGDDMKERRNTDAPSPSAQQVASSTLEGQKEQDDMMKPKPKTLSSPAGANVRKNSSPLKNPALRASEDKGSREAFEWLKREYVSSHFRVKLQPHPYFSHFQRAKKTVTLDPQIKAEMQRLGTGLCALQLDEQQMNGGDSSERHTVRNDSKAQPSSEEPASKAPMIPGRFSFFVSSSPFHDAEKTTAAQEEHSGAVTGQQSMSGRKKTISVAPKPFLHLLEPPNPRTPEKEGTRSRAFRPRDVETDVPATDAQDGRTDSATQASSTRATDTPSYGQGDARSSGKNRSSFSNSSIGLWRQAEELLADELRFLVRECPCSENYNVPPADVLETLDTAVTFLAAILELPPEFLNDTSSRQTGYFQEEKIDCQRNKNHTAKNLLSEQSDGVFLLDELLEDVEPGISDFVASAEDGDRFPFLQPTPEQARTRMKSRKTNENDTTTGTRSKTKADVDQQISKAKNSAHLPGHQFSPSKKPSFDFSPGKRAMSSTSKAKKNYPRVPAGTDALCEVLIHCISLALPTKEDQEKLQRLLQLVNANISHNENDTTRLGKTGYLLSLFEIALAEAGRAGV
ncbi:unnamed protein product [Amoebophrya sp. A120]|nr:unnamed protein product [Amoebophrya sp. A120]|eukprot:GSA120T00012696001.1